MNDFTKEELILIAESIPYLLHLKTKERTELLKKIDNIINNYCEHKNDVSPLYTVSGDLPSAGFCYECNQPVRKEFIKS